MTNPSNLALTFEAKKHSDKSLSSNERLISFRVPGEDCPPELLSASIGSLWTVALVRQGENGEAVPAKQPQEDKAKTPLWDRPAPQVSALLCRQVKFQNWLNDYGSKIVTDEESCRQAIYHFCNVTSRSQLPNEAWNKIVREYRNFLDQEITEMYGR